MSPILWVRSSPLCPQSFGSDHCNYISNPSGQIIAITSSILQVRSSPLHPRSFGSDHHHYTPILWVRSLPLHPQSFGSDHRHYIPAIRSLILRVRSLPFYIPNPSGHITAIKPPILWVRSPPLRPRSFGSDHHHYVHDPLAQIITITLNMPVLLILCITHTFFTVTFLLSSSALPQTP